MAENSNEFVRTLIYAAKLSATEKSVTLRSVLDSIVSARFKSEIAAGGKTIISTTVGGQSVAFSVPDGISPFRMAQLALRAIGWLERQPDPENPDLSVLLAPPPKRIKFSFKHYRL